jgi:hypothetical protein
MGRPSSPEAVFSIPRMSYRFLNEAIGLMFSVPTAEAQEEGYVIKKTVVRADG